MMSRAAAKPPAVSGGSGTVGKLPAGLDPIGRWPVSERYAPETTAIVAEIVRQAYKDQVAVYPTSGCTSLDYGCQPKRSGWNLSLAKLNRVVDYPARDLTVTVEAGLTLADLAALLAQEKQWLPVDFPKASQATIGGLVATSWNGPRRAIYGAIRDQVIGIQAVDGRGTEFKAGGRVVKNVAGYDFCKLLTGSNGSLGVITQITFKVRPIAPARRMIAAPIAHWAQAESALAGLVQSNTRPASVNLLRGTQALPPFLADQAAQASGSGGTLWLAVGFEGSQAEVNWMLTQLQQEWSAQGIKHPLTLPEEQTFSVWQQWAEFGHGDAAGLVLRVRVPSSQACPWLELLCSQVPEANIVCHALDGDILCLLPAQLGQDPAGLLIKQLQPRARQAGGHVVVCGGSLKADLPRVAIWGPVSEDYPLMRQVREAFDPAGILNPGRFIFE